MNAISVGSTPTLIAAGGNRKFIHLFNNSNVNVYLSYDGDSATLTTANGFVLLPGAVLQINNDGHSNIFDQAVYGIVATGTAEVRIQGA